MPLAEVIRSMVDDRSEKAVKPLPVGKSFVKNPSSLIATSLNPVGLKH